MRKALIYDGEQVVGHVEIKREGMCFLIKCLCNPLSGMPERIAICTDRENQIDLGLCVPDGDKMTLVKRVRCADLENKEIKYIVSHRQKKDSIVLKTGMYFEMLEKLPCAKFALENRVPEIIFVDQSSSKPTGQ